MFEPEAIGQRIAQARNEAGLRQEDLADLIDISTRSVQGYEAGTTNAYRHIRAIAEVTGKTVEWLLHGEDPAEGDDRISRLVGEVAEIREMLEQVLESRDAPDEQGPEQEAEDS